MVPSRSQRVSANGVSREIVSYPREDGVRLNGMLYLPRDRDPSRPLPTLIWIYPAEFVDGKLAEQMDARRFRCDQIKEGCPFGAVLVGFALLLYPCVGGVGVVGVVRTAATPPAAIGYLAAPPCERRIPASAACAAAPRRSRSGPAAPCS